MSRLGYIRGSKDSSPVRTNFLGPSSPAERVHIRLAYNNRPRSLELVNRDGIFLRDAVLEMFKSGSRSNTAGIIKVFYTGGNAVQKAFPIAILYFFLGYGRLLQRSAVGYSDKRI